jgi:tetratricopeptide (TPR) repeat protein
MKPFLNLRPAKVYRRQSEEFCQTLTASGSWFQVFAGCCFLGLSFLGWLRPAQAAFDLERAGARASGMAGAFTAVADDADALVYNPAGLEAMKLPTLATEYSRLLTGLDTDTLSESRLAYVQPLQDFGTLGLGWYGQNLAGVYQENVFVAAGGFTLDKDETWKVGAALKVLQASYLDSDALTANSDFFSAASSKIAFTADLGVLLNLDNGVSAGLSLDNVTQPDISLKGGYNLPMQVRAGAAWTYTDGLSALDFLYADGNERVSGGTEYWWWNRTLGTRVGLGTGNAGLLEITAGLSVRLKFQDWAPQFDYAFVNPLGDFAGAGMSHRLNLSLSWGAPQEDAEALQGKQLKAKGDEAFSQGKTEEALDAYELAAEFLPDDHALAVRIDALHAHVQHVAEINLYLKQGHEFQKNGNFQNALTAYQKVLALEPNLEASNQVEAVKASMRRMTEDQRQQEQKQERQAAERTRQAARQESREALQTAQRALERARRNPEVRRLMAADLARLDKQWNSANQLWRDGESEQAQAMALAVAGEVDKLYKKVSRRQVQENHPRRVPAAALAREEAAETATAGTATPAAVGPGTLPAPAVEKPLPSAETGINRPPVDEKQRRHARGAYGRAVKLMLDIDKLQGQKYFPDEFAALQNEISRIKTLMGSEDYIAVVNYAEGVFPLLEKLKAKCVEKQKASEVMPTNW